MEEDYDFFGEKAEAVAQAFSEQIYDSIGERSFIQQLAVISIYQETLAVYQQSLLQELVNSQDTTK